MKLDQLTKPQMAFNEQHGAMFLTTEQVHPNQTWLSMQKVKPAKDAIWFRAFPCSGGAINVDINTITHSRDIVQQDIISAIQRSNKSFNPALNAIRRLVEPTAYIINISEEQRQIIIASLAATRTEEEAVILHEMLEQLPAAEKENPGIIHGLCL